MRLARLLSIGGLVILLLTASPWLLPASSFAADSPAAFPAPKDLPPRPGMPDPLIAADGQPISTPAQWQRRREEMKEIIRHYAIGHMPPAPGNVTGHELESTMLADGKVSYRRVRLTFGPEAKLGFDVSIFTPSEASGVKAPFPTIVQPSFRPISETVPPSTHTESVQPSPDTSRSVSPEKAASQFAEALNRGYAVVTFFYQDCGLDRPDFRNSGFFMAYPEYDWADLAAWAWGMSRCVDYLEHQGFADKSKLIAVGHSRLGKATLVAGAFDERFGLVAPAGSGCGGTGAYRFNGKDRGGREGLEDIVKNFPQWTSPRLAEFSGQVEKLPFDQHWLIALVAPRLFIATDGLDDRATSVNALVQAYQAAKPVYAMLAVPDHLGINFRPGKHMIAPEDWTAILDFSDQHLRKMGGKRRFDELPPMNGQ